MSTELFSSACGVLIASFFSLMLVFSGYKLFRIVLPIWGFFFGFFLGAQINPDPFQCWLSGDYHGLGGRFNCRPDICGTCLSVLPLRGWLSSLHPWDIL